MRTFTELGLSKPITDALKDKGFTEPTDIQKESIPKILEARDLMASAQTGSGKTAAFALPIIECLEMPDSAPRALVLTPTRELALQVESQFKIFGKHLKLKTVSVYGGASMHGQAKQLKAGVDIIVATPGRLYDFVKRRVIDLGSLEILVLDEADRLLDMGFKPQIEKIVAKISNERQTLMFSATIDNRVENLASKFLNDPETIRVNSENIEPSEIEQRIIHVNEFQKDSLLAKTIKEMDMDSVLIFTGMKRKASWVTDRLKDAGIKAREIHGDVSQSLRERTLADFRSGKFSVLVATDVAARGLDIPSISHVINYDLPKDPESYVHRIGRTGRAGRDGIAISFVSEDQRFLLREIEEVIGKVLDPEAAARRKRIAMRRRTMGRRRII